MTGTRVLVNGYQQQMGMSWDRRRCLGIQVRSVAVLQCTLCCHTPLEPQGVAASSSGHLLSVSAHRELSMVLRSPPSTALGHCCAQSPGTCRLSGEAGAGWGPSEERCGLGKPRAPE